MSMKPTPIPTSWWLADNLLVSVARTRAATLPTSSLARLRAAGVSTICYVIDRNQFREAGSQDLSGSLAAPAATDRSRTPPKLYVECSYWDEGDVLPTARQVRNTLDWIDDMHNFKRPVCVHGAGHSARAILAAGCWLARHGRTDDDRRDPHTARLGWLELARRTAPGGGAAGAWTLSQAAQAFVCAWPSGRNAEPVLTAMELDDEEEIYPTATADHWMSTLRTVRYYRHGRHADTFLRAPVRAGGVGLILPESESPVTLQDMHEGMWVGERTLRLGTGAVIVFI